MCPSNKRNCPFEFEFTCDLGCLKSLGLKSLGLKSLGLKSLGLKSLGLKSLGLKSPILILFLNGAVIHPQNCRVDNLLNVKNL
jgi:hypothetical protein